MAVDENNGEPYFTVHVPKRRGGKRRGSDASATDTSAAAPSAQSPGLVPIICLRADDPALTRRWAELTSVTAANCASAPTSDPFWQTWENSEEALQRRRRVEIVARARERHEVLNPLQDTLDANDEEQEVIFSIDAENAALRKAQSNHAKRESQESISEPTTPSSDNAGGSGDSSDDVADHARSRSRGASLATPIPRPQKGRIEKAPRAQ